MAQIRHLGSRCLQLGAAIFFLGLMLLACAGCWDAIDIDKRSFISVIGVDCAASQQNTEGLKLSILVAQTKPSPAGDGGAQGGQSGTPEPIVLDDTGIFVEEAIANLRSHMTGFLDISTLQYIVLGEGLQPENLTSTLETMLFTSFAPMTPYVFTTDGSAGEVLKASLQDGKALPDALDSMRSQSKYSYGFLSRMPQAWQVLSDLINKNGDIAIPVINKESGGKGLKATGVAVYDGPHRVGSIPPEHAMLLYYVSEGSTTGADHFFSYEGSPLVARIESVRSKTDVKRSPDGKLQFSVELRVAARLLDSGGYRVPLVGTKKMAQIAKTLAGSLEYQLGILLRQLQALNSDAMKLYHAVRPVMPEISFEEFKGMYPSIQVRFSVSARLIRPGLLR